MDYDDSEPEIEIFRMCEVKQKSQKPLDIEARGCNENKTPATLMVMPSLVVFSLAFQSLGIVYGDLGTSPLYVFQNTFPRGIAEEESLMGVLSCIIYSLTLIPLIKYTFFVMRANDNGEGGTFALYSLICRHARLNAITNQHPTDHKLTTYSREKSDPDSPAGKTKQWLEAKHYRQNILIILVLIGTCMVIGDGILTPAISVLSSVNGIKVNDPKISNDFVVAIACIILVGLFLLQRIGTQKVSWAFAPVALIWFLSIGLIGLYNIIKHEPGVVRAFSPHYIVRYFARDKTDAWISLGGIVLSITGTEAMYADVSHFSASSIQVAFTILVFPCLLAAYMGQAAYLTKFPEHVQHAFYKSIPSTVYWPMLVIAMISATIASQAIISATFSIIKQAQALGCFPTVKVVHTSDKMSGQIYIPEINWILMILCVSITAGFQNTTQIGNAYGMAVSIVMLVTTFLMALVMLMVWQSNIVLVAAFTCTFLLIELVYFSSVLFKVDQGGWVPLVIAFIFLTVMYVWHYGNLKKYQFEMHSKVSIEWILSIGPSLGLVRVPGIGLVYSDLAHKVPPIFSHFVTHLPALHSVVIFVCIKYVPVNTVPTRERFLIGRIGPKHLFLYRCVVRYGYKDLHRKDDRFEQNLIDHLIKYVQDESSSSEYISESNEGDTVKLNMLLKQTETLKSIPDHIQTMTTSVSDPILSETSTETNKTIFNTSRHKAECRFTRHDNDHDHEFQVLCSAREDGIVHMIGDIVVRAKRPSNIVKVVAIDYIYAFLRRTSREDSVTFNIPHESLFSIGQVYFV